METLRPVKPNRKVRGTASVTINLKARSLDYLELGFCFFHRLNIFGA